MAIGQPSDGGNLGFEGDLFKAVDKPRGNLDPSEYSVPEAGSFKPDHYR